MPVRINDGGTVVGCYHDTDTMGTMHGFVYADGNYSALDGSWENLNMPASMNRGLVPDGSITVGHYTDMTTNYNHGYLVGGGVLAAFNFPFSLGTSALDINASGEVAGLYTDAAKKVHGFLLELGDSIGTLGLTSLLGPFRFTTIDFPGATATQVLGINSKGDVVGVYTDSTNKSHAFVLTRGRHHQD